MIFTSPIFLFLFLPVVLSLFLLTPQRLRIFFLLLASLVFFFWAEKWFVLVVIVLMVVNYCFGLLMDAFCNSEEPRPKGMKTVLGLAVAFNLGLLGYFKYAGFVLSNINTFAQSIGLAVAFSPYALHLPLGISFFTFRALSYVIDVYNRKVAGSKNLMNISLFISFFPTAIAGPLVRYGEMASGFGERSVTIEKFSIGLRRFIIGLGKKCLIADTLGPVVNQIFALSPGQATIEVAWLGIVAYTLQIYFDFSGYSDMAIGLGKMFGFDFLENFNYPYISQSVREFWRRWHISLSTWFRDYLYIPLGGNRRQSSRLYLNLIIVFFFCGLWHGASWNFVIWGLWHGSFLILERLKIGRWTRSLWRPLRHLYLLLVVILGWVWFRAETLPLALAYFKALFGISGTGRLEYSLTLFLNQKVEMALLAGFIFSGPVSAFIMKTRRTAQQKYDHLFFRVADQGISIGQAIALACLLAASFLSIAGGTHTPFIYFKF